jgi:hypothetical protein
MQWRISFHSPFNVHRKRCLNRWYTTSNSEPIMISFCESKDVSANTWKYKKIAEINQLYENEYSPTVCSYWNETMLEGPHLQF